MSAFGIVGSNDFSEVNSGIQFRIEQSDMTVLYSFDFNWDVGLFKFNTFEYIFNNTQDLINPRIVYCRNVNTATGSAYLSQLSLQ